MVRDKERDVLLVEDNAGDARLLEEYLGMADGGPYRITVAGTLAAARDHLAHSRADFIILDLNLPDSSGLDTVEQIQEHAASTPIVVLTGLDDEQMGLKAMRRGAQDYLAKGDLNSQGLVKALHYAEERHRLLRQTEADRKRLAENERRFRTLAQENADGIVVIDQAGIVQFANPAAETLFGKPAGELCEQPFGFPLDLADHAEITMKQSDGGERIVEMRTAETVWEGKTSYLISLRDISERKRMERALEASRERFAKVFHASPYAMGITSLTTGCIIDANERALNLFGYSRGEVIGRSAQKLGLWVQEEYRQMVDRAFEEKGSAREMELEARTKSGELRDALVTFERVDLEDEPVVLTIIEDITERKRVEAARRQALERLKILHEIDMAILSAKSTEQIAATAVEKVVALLELDRGSVALFDFPGGSFRLLTVCDDGNARAKGDEGVTIPLNAFRGDLEALQAGQIEIVQEIADRATREDDRFHIMRQQELRSFVSAPLLLDGELIGALNLGSATPGAIEDEHAEVAREVANQLSVALREERLATQMRRQATQLKEIMDAVPDAILLLDGDYHILSANRRARVLLADSLDLVTDDRLTHLGATPLSSFLKPTAPGAPRREIRLEEEGRTLEIGVSTMSLPDQQAGWVLVLRDVTKQREQEEYLQTQERLAAVGQLAAGIAHDFNNVMSIITLYSESLLRKQEHPKKDQYLATISEQARHAAKLISQILDFSRRSVMKQQRLNLQPFVKEMVKLLERIVPENITIRLTAAGEEAVVAADPTRLQQALMNLAVNARDAMPDGGVLHLTLDALTVGSKEEAPLPSMGAGKWVTLTVSDTGTGIAPDALPHLFEPFFTTKEEGKGTGLGLAQVYGIVKQHDGEISVSTEAGKGTTFTIYLPAYLSPTASAEQAKELRRPEQPTPAGQTILVVEDNDVVREAIVSTLEGMKFRVLEAADGLEGLRKYEEEATAIDLVISDMVMPNMSGAALHQRISEAYPGVKMILISGYPRDEEGKALLDNGGVFWIEKPFTAEGLGAAVYEALGGTSEKLEDALKSE